VQPAFADLNHKVTPDDFTVEIGTFAWKSGIDNTKGNFITTHLRNKTS
jgi:hypothetical protein